jgi:hypothetical protein
MADVPIPFLISAAEARKRRVKCRECGSEVSLGAGSCPACGFANPAERPSRSSLLVVLAIIVGGIGSYGAWRMGLIKQRPGVGVSVAADSAAIESRFDRISPRFRPDPPRALSPRFTALCLTPAPVLVYEMNNAPTMFRIQLDRQAGDPKRLTDALVKRHRLMSAGFDSKRYGIFTWEVSPTVVSALRCEPGVASIEEVSH